MNQFILPGVSSYRSLSPVDPQRVTRHPVRLFPAKHADAFGHVPRRGEAVVRIARSRHLETLSDAAADPDGFTLGAGYEFLTRPDGYPLLATTYPIKWRAAPKSMDLGLVYTALTQKQVSMVAANSTDGLLNKLDVKVLKDDKQAFPPYQACIVVRSDTLAANPDVRKTLSELSGNHLGRTLRTYATVLQSGKSCM